MGNNIRIDFENCIMTLLSKNQVFGKDKLDFFKEFTNDCSATDFAILQGCGVSNEKYVGDEESLKTRKCNWDTCTPILVQSGWYAEAGDEENRHHENYMHKAGLRPAFPFNGIEYIGKVLNMP